MWAYTFTIAIITYYAGVLVWRERDAWMDEIHDALPFPEWISYTAKLTALMVVISLLQLLAGGAAVVVQAANRYFDFNFGLYANDLFLRDLSLFLFLAVMAFFLHVLAPNKYIGYFAFIGFLIVNTFGWEGMHVATRMVRFASRPGLEYSAFFGYAPVREGWWWFTAYWTAFCGLLSVAAVLLWPRGRETAWRHRWRVAGQRWSGGLRLAGVVAAAGFLGVGAWVFHNTKILNTVRSDEEDEILQADYEKTYKKFESMALPRVEEIRYDIEIYPSRRTAVMKGRQTLRNTGTAPLGEVHLTLDDDVRYTIEIAGASLEKDDRRLGYRIYRLAPALEPGGTRRMTFQASYELRGFSNGNFRATMVQNGTFFNNQIAPQIGYQGGRELRSKNDRKKRGLSGEVPSLPPLERNCVENCRNSYLSSSSDWVNVETVVGTEAGQLAIAPGSLLREWTENGRRYFHYRLDHPSANFYSFLSAGYEVRRETWNGISLEVYHLKEHAFNVGKMMEGMRKTIDYCARNFAPYRHRQARIIEFPRVAQFAQAFPGTMPYSESIGFIANLNDPEDIDQVFYIVAHEIAHQWWAHQVLGANMQGATLLSETMAQYTALMVMEQQYGRDMMRKFLKYEMDRYLRSRGAEELRERPLISVDAGQGYIHYPTFPF